MGEVVNLGEARRVERDRQIFRLRLAGVPAREIADQLGITRDEVYAGQARMCAGVTDEFKQQLRELELERCEAIHRKFFVDALQGDAEAAVICLRFMDRKAKYVGLDVLPTATPSQDDRRESSEFDKIFDAIVTIANKGPVIDGEIVTVQEPPPGGA